MRLSIVIVTHNRRDALGRTLDVLAANAHLPHRSMEVIVVDNGSTDGTASQIQRDDLDIQIIRRERNEGVSARNHAFAVARGEYLMLIDDDSYPLDDAAIRSIGYLDQSRSCAAVVGRIELPDGSLEASALPGVVANGAVVLRKSVIDEVGGFPTEFFRQAEEYDLSFRIWNAGYRIERFEDLLYRHEKVGGNRAAAIIHRMDMRNNLILIDRYLPARWREAYRADWTQRYHALAQHAGMAAAAWRGRLGAAPWRVRAMLTGRQTLNEHAFEAIFNMDEQTQRIAAWVERHSIRHVAIADFSKNIRATRVACERVDVETLVVADGHPAYANLTWDGLAVEPDELALSRSPDGVILSNINPARVSSRLEELRKVFAGPILALWEPQFLESESGTLPANYHDAA